jgi:ribosomal protein S18 acetylase RimI-like enzyme
MALSVRFAEISDLGAIRDFGRRIVVPFYESIGLPEYGEAVVAQYWESSVQENAIAEGRVIVADDDGAVVGVTEFGSYEGEPIMWKLYVEPLMRGRGIGSRLVDELIAAVAGRASSVLTEHAAENNEAARFYDRIGFNVAWIEEAQGPGVTTIFRRKQLPVQAPTTH